MKSSSEAEDSMSDVYISGESSSGEDETFEVELKLDVGPSSTKIRIVSQSSPSPIEANMEERVPLYDIDDSVGEEQRLKIPQYQSRRKLTVGYEAPGIVGDVSESPVSVEGENSFNFQEDNLANQRRSGRFDGVFASKENVAVTKKKVERKNTYEKRERRNRVRQSGANKSKALTEASQTGECLLDGLALRRVPDDVFRMRDLYIIDLSDNNLSEFPEFEQPMLKLEQFLAANNGISKLPDSFKMFPNLLVLDLSDNAIRRFPIEFRPSPKLEICLISGNRLKTFPTNVPGLENLIELAVSDNNIVTLPEDWSGLRSLKRFYCAGNGVKRIPDGFFELKDLEVLNLKQNDLVEIPQKIGLLTNLTWMSMPHNNIRDLPPTMARNTKLVELYLHENKIRRIDKTIFEEMKELEVLTLGKNSIRRLPETISCLQSLRKVWLNDNRLRDIPRGFERCVHLQLLVLSRNRIKRLSGDVVASMTLLEQLHLDENKLRYLPDEIGRCSRLKHLLLNDNRLLTLPPSVGLLVEMLTFNIMGNKLQCLPHEMCKLEKLETIEVSKNPYLLTPPKRVCSSGVKAIRSYLSKEKESKEYRMISRFQKIHLHSVKMLITVVFMLFVFMSYSSYPYLLALSIGLVTDANPGSFDLSHDGFGINDQLTTGHINPTEFGSLFVFPVCLLLVGFLSSLIGFTNKYNYSFRKKFHFSHWQNYVALLNLIVEFVQFMSYSINDTFIPTFRWAEYMRYVPSLYQILSLATIPWDTVYKFVKDGTKEYADQNVVLFTIYSIAWYIPLLFYCSLALFLYVVFLSFNHFRFFRRILKKVHRYLLMVMVVLMPLFCQALFLPLVRQLVGGILCTGTADACITYSSEKCQEGYFGQFLVFNWFYCTTVCPYLDSFDSVFCYPISGLALFAVCSYYYMCVISMPVWNDIDPRLDVQYYPKFMLLITNVKFILAITYMFLKANYTKIKQELVMREMLGGTYGNITVYSNVTDEIFYRDFHIYYAEKDFFSYHQPVFFVLCFCLCFLLFIVIHVVNPCSVEIINTFRSTTFLWCSLLAIHSLITCYWSLYRDQWWIHLILSPIITLVIAILVKFILRLTIGWVFPRKLRKIQVEKMMKKMDAEEQELAARRTLNDLEVHGESFYGVDKAKEMEDVTADVSPAAFNEERDDDSGDEVGGFEDFIADDDSAVNSDGSDRSGGIDNDPVPEGPAPVLENFSGSESESSSGSEDIDFELIAP